MVEWYSVFCEGIARLRSKLYQQRGKNSIHSCDSSITGSVVLSVSLSSRAPPHPHSPVCYPSAPHVCGSSRRDYSCNAHLFVFSHYCGLCCLRRKVKSRPQTGQWKPAKSLQTGWGQTNYTDHCNRGWWALDKWWMHSSSWCISDT